MRIHSNNDLQHVEQLKLVGILEEEKRRKHTELSSDKRLFCKFI